jgi:hypothetical protein
MTDLARVEGADEDATYVVQFAKGNKPTCPACDARIPVTAVTPRARKAGIALVPSTSDEKLSDLAKRKKALMRSYEERIHEKAKKHKALSPKDWDAKRTLEFMAYTKHRIKQAESAYAHWVGRMVLLEARLKELGVSVPDDDTDAQPQAHAVKRVT